jgi:hypothetical protein
VAASARDRDVNADTVSILSRSSSKASSRAPSRRKSNGSLNFVVGGAQRQSFESDGVVRDAEGEAWPMGIIKTVSVEVTQEDAPDLEQGMDIGEIKRSASRQDWDRQFA